MIDVRRNDGAATRDFSPDKLRSDRIWDLRLAICNRLRAGMVETQIVPIVAVDRGTGINDPGYSPTHVFAKRDEFHLGSYHTLSGVIELSNWMRFGSQNFPADTGRRMPNIKDQTAACSISA